MFSIIVQVFTAGVGLSMLIAAAPSIIVTSVEFADSVRAGIIASMQCGRSDLLSGKRRLAIVMVDTLDFHVRKICPNHLFCLTSTVTLEHIAICCLSLEGFFGGGLLNNLISYSS